MAVSILCCVAAFTAFAEGKPKQTKKLIEFGWDEPDPAFMRQHIAEMERNPFDGVVFHLDYTESNGRGGNFAWQVWGRRAFTPRELERGLDDLKATGFTRFRYNFLRFNVTPGDLDWFDDFSAVLNNARLASKIAKAGQAKGLLLDVEQYQEPLFDYRRQSKASSKTWQEYADQARNRGRALMAAFQDGFPGLTVFLTFGYSLPWQQSGGGATDLSACPYGLLAPFLDGLVAAARGKARLVDGYEFAYGFKDTGSFPAAYRTMKNDLLSLVQDRKKYLRVVSFSFGIWLDAEWRQQGWNTAEVTKNFHGPEQFETLVREAVEVADEYVWIYSETPRWWAQPDGKSVNLPAAYKEALSRSRGMAR